MNEQTDRPTAGEPGPAVIAALELAPPLLYFTVNALFSRLLARFQLNPDEGLNLIKAALLRDGHALYGRIWSDQPPLMTWLLRLLFDIAGEEVLTARLLILAFASILLWGCIRFARLAWGPAAAVAAALLLPLTPHYHVLAVPVLIGLPSVALACLSLASIAQWHRSRKDWLAALSGALLALSVLTKLFTGILVPVMLAGIAIGSRREGSRRPLALWSGAFAATLAAAAILLFGPDPLAYLLTPHLAASKAAIYESGFRMRFDSWRLPLLGALALAGTLWSLSRAKWLALYPLAWAAIALPLLVRHRPFWFHQMLLLTVPAALLASAAAAAAWAEAARRLPPLRWTVAAALALALGIAGAQALDLRRIAVPPNHRYRDAVDGRFVGIVRATSRDGDTMLTDVPMIAFRAGVRIPPATVLSEKRVVIGDIDEAGLIASFREHRPPFVLLGRFAFPRLRAEVSAAYRLALSRDGRTLFVAPWRGDAVAACRWPQCDSLPGAWYRSAEAGRLLRAVLASQHADGGWAKNEDRGLTLPPDRGGLCGPDTLEECSTIDNDATTSELRFLDRVIGAGGGTADARDAYARGIDFLLSAQLAPGGWPQVPAAPPDAYQAAITLNDGAMVHVLSLLQSVAAGRSGRSLHPAQRVRASAAFERGVAFLLQSRMATRGGSGWCAQYDRESLAPAAARPYEPVSLGPEETADVLDLLMRIEKPDAALREAVEGGVAWLSRTRDTTRPAGQWPRFVDPATGAALFVDRKGNAYTDLLLLPDERRLGYRWRTDAPRRVVEELYPRWRRDQEGPQ